MLWWMKATAFLLLLSLCRASPCPVECTGPYANTYWKGVKGEDQKIILWRNPGQGPLPSIDDVLMIIQMQGGAIEDSNTPLYGSNTGTGNGYTDLGPAGWYEFVVVTGARDKGSLQYEVDTDVTLAHEYKSRDANRFQVILVPFCNVATIDTSTVIPSWDGSIGGVLAVLANTIRLGDVSLQGKGFRGGPLVDRFSQSLDASVNQKGYRDDTSTSSPTLAYNGPKGEGFIGSPRIQTRTSTYPDGLDCARGAPGNAGGGGNVFDSGGGGGANAGQGGDGRIYTKSTYKSGIGGALLPTTANERLFLGMYNLSTIISMA